MNVIFISPHFPSHFYRFCQRLKERGVTVLGIGDAPWEGLSPECRNSLTEYCPVSSLEQYEEVYRAAAGFISRYGRIDFVESQNEYWLELDARPRTDFNIPTGPRLEEMADMNHKSRMKAAYARAGIPTARWCLPETEEQAGQFAEAVGWPVIVKPDKGVGAVSTYRLKNREELSDFWNRRDSRVPFIEEEYVPGHVETFDGITDSQKKCLFCASQVMGVSLMDAVNGNRSVVSWCQAPAEDLREAGTRVLQQFDTRNKFFHFEFFRLDEDKPGLGRKGDLLGLEVNMRAPGGRIPDKINFAFDTDVYTIWADSLIYDRCFMDGSFRRYITHVGRKDGRPYLRTAAEVDAALGEAVLEEFDVSPALAAEMGNHAWLLKADTDEQRRQQIRLILEEENAHET